MSDTQLIFDRALLKKRRDRAARSGDGCDFLFREGAVRLADRLLDIQRGFPLALDLGSHGGCIAEEVADLPSVGHVIQSDIAEGYARQAKAHGPALVADEEWLPIRPESLDLVISNLSLHWVNDLPGAFIQVNHALKADGLFIGALLGGDTLYELRECLMQAEIDISGGVSPRISPFAEIRDVGSLMQRAGFALPVIDSETVTVRYENMFRLLSDLRGMGETNMLIQQARGIPRRAIFMRAAELYQERFQGEDGRIPATFQMIFLHGWAPHDSQQKPMRPGSAKTRLADALETDEVSVPDKTGNRATEG
ncbi:methyltransferase domain-containing protein [Aestuariispira insulae]|uniref:Methyltransferase family protein n=1 Tax=Aestuariispira insulae TaxID=1461337 RepID=A0A3D9HDV5_9PROT|nr:methyltransferase domain-containing protein [Aestuariispira insulae]RED47650.1 methyltransferase family protein [Aestuariispira insulae]